MTDEVHIPEDKENGVKNSEALGGFHHVTTRPTVWAAGTFDD